MFEEHDAVDDDECTHGVVFDELEWRSTHPTMTGREVRARWPRLYGKCPNPRCPFDGIAYASFLHYLAGDW